MDDLAERFIKLFRGRGDAFGSWEGGSVREPLTPAHFVRHLHGAEAGYWIGVYPHLGAAMDQHVTWGCIDIDGKDFPEMETVMEPEWEDWDRRMPVEQPTGDHDWDAMWELATKLHAVLAIKDVHVHIERTRNGFHLWVFPDGGHVLAATMRRALMAACKAVGYDPKEVNPKQEELLPGKLGNYVRLPYYGALSDPDYRGWPAPEPRPSEIWQQPDRYFVPLDEPTRKYGLQSFLDNVKLTSVEALEAVAQLWTPPARVTFDGPPPEDVEAILPLLDGMAYTIWKDGPLEGRDRSNTLAKLAYRLRDTDIQMPAAFAVVRDADRRWGKFFDRPDCDEQIMAIVERAYSS